MNFGLPVGKHRWWKGGCYCGNQSSVILNQKEVCDVALNMKLEAQNYYLASKGTVVCFCNKRFRDREELLIHLKECRIEQ